MNVPLVNLQKQYQEIKKEVEPKVLQVLSKGNFILGQEEVEFEKSFADYIGTKYCIGVSSGSFAILLALRVLNVGPGDEVITQANTFISTALPILELGATPILVDIDPKTYQIDTATLEKAITKKTKVIMPVHLYGIPADMDTIMAIAKKYNIAVVEDACQAHGSSINGKKCGSFGIVNAFSFYPGKNLGAAGDGGAITTNDPKLAETLMAMRNIGQTEKYKHDIFGYNSRLDTIHAAVLSVKLKYLEQWNQKRREKAALFNKLLSDLPLTLPPQPDYKFVVNYHLYVIRTKNRDKLLEYLHQNGVGAGIHYPIPIHLQKAVKGLMNYKKGDFPMTESYAKEILSLPIYAELGEDDIIGVSELIHNFFEQK